MLLTEKQAREKWCPQVREPYVVSAGVDGHSITGVNKGTDKEQGMSTCIASDCVMWRFDMLGVYCPQCHTRYVGRYDSGKECNSCKGKILCRHG